MASTATYTTDASLNQSPRYGVFPQLPHCDLLSFLTVAQTLDCNFLEYTPRYEMNDGARTGGNALVQMIYLDRHRQDLQFAFKRFYPGVRLTQKEKLRKLIGELAVYDHFVIKEHRNIVNLTGITWSIETSGEGTNSGTHVVSPVLGFRPSENGNLAEYLAPAQSRDIRFIDRLRLCADIGHAIETLHSLSKLIPVNLPGAIHAKIIAHSVTPLSTYRLRSFMVYSKQYGGGARWIFEGRAGEQSLTVYFTTDLVHGDLKPENVLIFDEDGRPVAKLIDFDCSCFGLTDDTYVSIAGTRGWLAPEFVRGNPRCKLQEAKKADLYSFAKLCAWIIFGHVVDIKHYVRNAGRISSINHEKFDFAGAMDCLLVSQSFACDFADVQRLTRGPIPLLERFFQESFIGCPEKRTDEFFRVIPLLQHAIRRFEVVYILEKLMSDGPQNFFLTLISLTKIQSQGLANYLHITDQSSARAAQKLVGRLKRLWASCLHMKPKPLTFNQKQALFTVTRGFILNLVIISCSITLLALDLVYWRKGQLTLNPDESEHSLLSPALVIWTFIICYCLGFFAILHIVAWLLAKVFHVHSPAPYSDLKDLDCYQIGNSNRILRSFSRDPHISSLPLLAEIFPLLNRLHYRVRVQLVDNLIERTECQECQQLATIQLAFCKQLALGIPKGNQMDSYLAVRQLKELSSRAEHFDKGYHVSLPNMPQEVISFLQDHRVDQFVVGELSDAIISIFQEVRGKINRGRPLRSTQVLYTTLGQLFTLIGRYEEAEICYRNALNHLPPANWRMESFGERMREASDALAEKRAMRLAQKRVQLEEAEHNLFAFSLVQSLETQGKVKDAIQVLLTIKSITAGPNGLYVRRETGGQIVMAHRIIVARNLLIGLLIGQSKLDEVRAMGQHLDLRDVLHFCEPWDSRVLGCFEVSEKMSTALFTQGRYCDASKLQRDRLTTCLELLPSNKMRIRSAMRDLAISLSHQADSQAVEEAYQLQRQLIDEQDESDLDIGSIKLNYAFTLGRLGEVNEALAFIQALQRQQQPTQRDQMLFNFSPDLCSYSLEGSEAPLLLQKVFLDTCKRVCNQDSQLALISLVFNCSQQSALSEGSENLVTLLRDILNTHSRLILPADRHILWSYLLFVVSSRGLISEDLKQLEEAVKLSNEMYNEMSMISNEPIVITKADCLMASVYSKKAFFLYHVRGIGQGDLPVLKESITLHRKALQMCTQTMGSGDCNTLGAKENLARNLFDHGVTLHREVEISEAIELYKEILIVPTLDISASLLLETDLHYAQTVLDRILGGEARHENDMVQRLDMERIKRYYSEDHPRTRIQQNRLAELHEQRGQIKEALELLETSSNACESACGDKHPETLRAKMAIVLFRQRTGAHHYEILPELSRLRHQAARSYGSPRHASAIDYLGHYASCLILDPMAVEEALSLKRQVVNVFIDLFGRCHTKTISAMGELAYMLSRRGGQDYRDGMRLLEESLDLSVSLLGLSHPLTGSQWKCLLSEQHAQLKTYNEELIKKVNYELREFRYPGGPLTSEHDLRHRWLDPRVANEGIRVVWSIQLLSESHKFTAEVSRQFIECLCRPEVWDLKEDQAENVRQCMETLAYELKPSFFVPEAHESITQWTAIRQELRLMGGVDFDGRVI